MTRVRLTSSAKKRAQVLALLRQREHRKRLVNIGDQVAAWNDVKTELQVENDREVARVLIER